MKGVSNYNMEANIVLGRCYLNRQLFGMRVEKRNFDWVRTWAFRISEKSASAEGFDKVNITGSFDDVDEYPGCPYCGGRNIIVCGNCGKITCRYGDQMFFTCQWCGTQSQLQEVETLSTDAGQY